MLELEWAWAAGFVEGESSIIARRVAQSPTLRLMMSIPQVERAPLDRLVALFGFGRVLGPYDYGTKPIHRVQFTGDRLIPVLDHLMQYTSPWWNVKAQKAIDARKGLAS